jgi:hypothetical protein
MYITPVAKPIVRSMNATPVIWNSITSMTERGGKNPSTGVWFFSLIRANDKKIA